MILKEGKCSIRSGFGAVAPYRGASDRIKKMKKGLGSVIYHKKKPFYKHFYTKEKNRKEDGPRKKSNVFKVERRENREAELRRRIRRDRRGPHYLIREGKAEWHSKKDWSPVQNKRGGTVRKKQIRKDSHAPVRTKGTSRKRSASARLKLPMPSTRKGWG